MDEWVVVYRGFALPTLDMIEAMLEAEGLQPRRMGKASPALLGVGDSAVEQLIEVPREHEQSALALIASSRELPAQTDELEAQALSTPADRPRAADADSRGFDRTAIALFVACAIAVILWLSIAGR